MIKYKKVPITSKVAESYVCDVCGKEVVVSDYVESQEFHAIFINGGYGSVFGDGCRLTLDICQHCLKEKLGMYFKEVEENNEE